MNLKKRNSRTLDVNLLSDFVLSKISPNEKTIIQVVDCENFYIIKGKTTSKELLNLPKILEEYSEKFKDFLPEKVTVNTIDLIEYDYKMDVTKEIKVDFFNTQNCSYPYNETPTSDGKENLVVCSEFPHGHSLSQGRALFYYLKNVLYSIPSNYIFTSLTFELKKGNKIDLKVFNNFFSDNEEDTILQSAILDCFDFDTSEIESKMKKIDWFQELTDPFSEYYFLKEVKKDFIII